MVKIITNKQNVLRTLHSCIGFRVSYPLAKIPQGPNCLSGCLRSTLFMFLAMLKLHEVDTITIALKLDPYRENLAVNVDTSSVFLIGTRTKSVRRHFGKHHYNFQHLILQGITMAVFTLVNYIDHVYSFGIFVNQAKPSLRSIINHFKVAREQISLLAFSQSEHKCSMSAAIGGSDSKLHLSKWKMSVSNCDLSVKWVDVCSGECK